MWNALKDVRKMVVWITGIAIVGVLGWLLLVPPVLGVADNGDFQRVMVTSGFAPLDPNESYDDHYFGYSHQKFAYSDYQAGGYVSSHVLLLAIAGWIGRIYDSNIFDIRWLGAVYISLFTWAVCLLVRYANPKATASKWQTAAVSAVAGAALLFVYGDVGYTAYFQSFFGEPYALVGMLFVVASAIAIASREEPSGKLLAIFIVAGLAVATSKIQNAPLGFVFSVLALRMFALRKDRRWHRQVLAGIAALVVFSTAMMVAAPSELRNINRYQSLFFGALKDTPQLERDLKGFGIPEKYAALAGTNYFQSDTVVPQTDPVLHREVLDRIGHKEIAFYYLRHPSRFIQKLERGADNAVYVRTYYLGNYDRSEGKPRGSVSESFSLWSQWKVDHLPRSLGLFAGFLVLYVAGLAVWWLRASSRASKLKAETLAAVALAGAFAVVIPLVGDGEADLAKHLFMFSVCFDMMVISVVTALALGLVTLAASARARS